MNEFEPVIGTGASISSGPGTDRLSGIGDAMLKAVPPGSDDVRTVVMLDDTETGTVAYRGYGPRILDQMEMLTDVAVHLVYLGRISGVEIEIMVNGLKMPDPPRD